MLIIKKNVRCKSRDTVPLSAIIRLNGGGGYCKSNKYVRVVTSIYTQKRCKTKYISYIWSSAYFSLSFPVISFLHLSRWGSLKDKLKSAEAILNERSSRPSVSLLTRQNKLFWLVHRFGTKLIITAWPKSDCGSISIFRCCFCFCFFLKPANYYTAFFSTRIFLWFFSGANCPFSPWLLARNLLPPTARNLSMKTGWG